MMGLQRQEIDAYDSKAEPVASATAALLAVNKAGREVIHRFFPLLSIPLDPDNPEPRLRQRQGPESDAHPSMESRSFASYANEDPALSPMPLLCVIWSLPESELSGRLKSLHDEIAPAMVLQDYSVWKLDDLRKAVNDMTTVAKTARGVKYRAPKTNFSFGRALQLYAMTLALLRMETKWADKADSPPPDMVDFTNRLRQQLPRQVRDRSKTAFFLYEPDVLNHPLSKEEFEERADVVVMNRQGMTVEVEQFPVYLTENQKEWSPGWIEAADEKNDTTLMARKFEHDWTRLDGPFLWFRGDQLSGQVIYRATVKLYSDEIVIEAERTIEHRGAVKRAQRPRDYDPALMSAFNPAVDAPAGPPQPEALTIDPPSVEEQVNSLTRVKPYFSNSFRAWCAYGLSISGRASDGKTWVAVLPDEPRPIRANASSTPVSPQLPPAQTVEAESAPLNGMIPYHTSIKSSATLGRSRGRFIVELANGLDSKKLRQGDKVDAKLTGMITLSNSPPIPRGAKVIGHVTEATNHSKSDPQSTLGLVFDKIVRPGGEEIRMHCVIQAVAPNPNAELNTESEGGLGGVNLGYADIHSAAPNAGHGKTQSLTDTSIGVFGIKNIKLGPEGVLTSSGKEVKLDSGTRILLNVTMQ